MIFADNCIKKQLRNVYFITGTPCGGKTTVSRALGAKYGIPVYDIDEQFPHHLAMSDPESQPNMNRKFKNADEFFGRPVSEYKQWLVDNLREQTDFIILDLIRLSQNGPVICDCHLTMDEINRLSDSSHAAFMITDPTDLVETYCDRPDHQDFSNYLHSASDYEAARKTVTDTLYSLNMTNYEAIKKSDFFWIERDINRNVDDTVALVEEHFGWRLLKNFEIKEVKKDSEFAAEFLSYVENCSWAEVKDHLAGLIRNWEFSDWETMFAAVEDGKIVGMASVLKTDYYPITDIYPWISSVFVSESHRGLRISGRLIDYVNDYLRGLGFRRSYIPSEFVWLYEHYGYHYVKEIVNYGGYTDHLYVKEI